MKKIKTAAAVLITVFSLLSGFTPETRAETVTFAVSSEYDISDATVFTFSDSGIKVTAGQYDGYKTEGTALTIKESGVYAVMGSCSNGTIVIKKNVRNVTLVLNGLTLSASATAPITCNKGSEVTIVVMANTVNNLADDQFNNDDIYTDASQYPDIENAVIKCKDGSNVTICGSGTLNITANGKNGIKGGYDLYEEDSEGNVTDVLSSTASLTIKEVTLNITANVNDAIKSDKLLNILSGNITITAVDDAIKSDYVLNIGEDGKEGPVITVVSSKEGIEGAVVNVWSGNVEVNASDDGINAANSDLQNYDFSYNQYGGYVYVNVTRGDGIDSNGSINLKGGKLEVYTPSQGDGDPLDSERGTLFEGATVLAVGHLGMPQGYSATTPYVVFSAGTQGMWNQGNATSLVSQGSTIEITDASGKVLYTAKAVRDAGYVLFADAALKEGETYTLTCNGKQVLTAQATTQSTNGMGGPGQFPGNNGGEGQFPANGQQPPEGKPGFEGGPQMPGGFPQNKQPEKEMNWFQKFFSNLWNTIKSWFSSNDQGTQI